MKEKDFIRYSLLPLLFLVMLLLLEVMPFPPLPPAGRAVLAEDGGGEPPAIPDQVWEPVGPSWLPEGASVKEIEAADQNVAYAVVDGPEHGPGMLLKTADYGVTWNECGPDLEWTCNLSVVDADTVWVGSVQQWEVSTAVTTDGGSSWRYAAAMSFQYCLEGLGGVHAWAGGYQAGGAGPGFAQDSYESEGRLYFRADPLPHTFPWCAVNDIQLGSEGLWAVGSGQYASKVWLNWEEKPLSPAPPGLESICPVAGGTVWVAGGAVLRSTDGGDTWTRLTLPQGCGSIHDIWALDADTAFAVGDYGWVIKTTDGGASWTRMYAPTTQHLHSVFAVDEDHAWAAGGRTVLRLVDHNTRPGSGVTVDLGNGDYATFDRVTAPGNTVREDLPVPNDEDLYCMDVLRDCVTGVRTSASYTGDITLSTPYGPYIRKDECEEAVRILKKTGSLWEDITTHVDTVNKVAYGRTDSLSEFALVYPYRPVIKRIDPCWGLRGNQCAVTVEGNGFFECSHGKPYVALWRSVGEEEEYIPAENVTVVSLRRITCTFPIPRDAFLGEWYVYVKNPDEINWGTRYESFRVMEDPTPDPVIIRLSPYHAPRGGTVRVWINGSGIWAAYQQNEEGSALPEVWLSREGQDDIMGYDVDVSEPSWAIVNFDIPPEAESGPWDVHLRNPDGKEATLAGGFMVTGDLPGPTITSIDPDTGVLGTSRVDVAIVGSGFWGRPDIRLTMGSAWFLAQDVLVNDPQHISCWFYLHPNRPPGVYDVFIRNEDGQEYILVGGFTVTAPPPPTVTSITPNSGARGTTVSVTDLAGSGFYDGLTVKLKKAGQPDITATGVTVVSPTRITCSLPIPAGAATGAWDVVVRNADGQEATLGEGFAVAPSGGNTPPGTGVEVDAGLGSSVTFESVSGGGITATTRLPDPEVADFNVLGGSCYNITTTATYSGIIVVVLPYDESSLTVPEASLRLLHKEGGEWRDVTSYVDTAADLIAGEVDSLSPFVIGWRTAQESTTWYLAEGCTALGMQTYVLVQNPGPSSAHVALTFQTGSGEVAGPEVDLPAGRRTTFLANTYVPDCTDVSTKVVASSPVICERAMYGPGMTWAHDSIGVTSDAFLP